jgi:hypothetical protein
MFFLSNYNVNAVKQITVRVFTTTNENDNFGNITVRVNEK